jgi:hypothetical protein
MALSKKLKDKSDDILDALDKFCAPKNMTLREAEEFLDDLMEGIQVRLESVREELGDEN